MGPLRDPKGPKNLHSGKQGFFGNSYFNYGLGKYPPHVGMLKFLGDWCAKRAQLDNHMANPCQSLVSELWWNVAAVANDSASSAGKSARMGII